MLYNEVGGEVSGSDSDSFRRIATDEFSLGWL